MDTELRVKESGTIGALPAEWVNVNAVDGDAVPWITAPVGTVYVQLDKTNNRNKRWCKMKADARDDDWCLVTHVVTRTITRAQMTDGGGTSGTYVLAETIPQGAWVQQSLLENITGFTGDTSAVIIVGDGSDTDRYNTGTPSVFTTSNAIDLGVPSGTKIHTAAATVTVTITSAADFTNVTAGQLTIRIYYLK